MFEENQCKMQFCYNFMHACKIILYYEIVRKTLLGQHMFYTACKGMPLISMN